MKQRKLLTSALAVGLAVALLFGGTMAWQSISQTALNEVAASVNPGGRLHDDFVDITTDPETGEKLYETMTFDKDVYVENFTERANNGTQVFARVRLDEYMELGAGAGEAGDESKYVSGTVKPLVDGATMEDKSSWSTYIFNDDTSPFRTYWEMSFGGSTVYMPTFNKNKDSLEADINGTFQGKNGTAFDDHVYYELGDVSGATTDEQYIAIYDKDAAPDGMEETDELADANVSAETVIAKPTYADAEAFLTNEIWNGSEAWKDNVELKEEEHTAVSTLDAEVMSMDEWLALDAEEQVGNFWVYDADGWAYWASPIDPETATGLLLTGIERTDAIINQDWYYAINVVAQFVTYDDLGQDDHTGFYDIEQGSEPTANALLLLNRIGVDVKFEVGTEDELAEALTHGGTVKLTSDVTINESIVVSNDTVLDLGTNKLKVGTNLWDDASKVWSPISVQGEGTTLIIRAEEGGSYTPAVVTNADDSYCVDVRDGAKVIIYGGKFDGNVSAVYVHKGEAVIYGGTFSIQQPASGDKGYNYVLNCYNENYRNGTAKITVCGGSFVKFDPSSDTAGDDGSFVPAGYTVTKDEATSVYTVTKTTAASTAGESTGE